jgi:hypothetical protein
MDEIRDGLTTLWERIFAWLPQLFGALALLLVFHIVAKALQKLARISLRRIGFDTFLHDGRAGEFMERILPRPSRFVGKIVYWAVFLWGITVALTVLGVPAINEVVSGIYDYLPNVLAAILIFLGAGAVTAATEAFIVRVLGDTPTGKVAGSVAPVIIMGIAVFMILDQLKIAPAIVTITYAGLMGSLFLGLALAFGLGGRDVAAQMLQKAYDAGQRSDAQYKRDLAVGRERVKQDTAKVKEQVKRRTR